MDNLTQDKGLVREATSDGGNLGFRKVVYRERGSVLEWVASHETGEAFRPKLHQRLWKFVIYEVTSEADVVHRFSRPYQTLDQQHDFSLEFRLHVEVTDPKRLVETTFLGSVTDPLRKLEQFVADEVGRAVSRLEWTEIWDGNLFARAVEELRNPRSGVRQPPHTFVADRAEGWGLGVLGLDLDRVLPPDAVAPDGQSTVGSRKTNVTSAAKVRDQGILDKAKEEERVESGIRRKRGDAEIQRAEIEHHMGAKFLQIIDRLGDQIDDVPHLRRVTQELLEWQTDLVGMGLNHPSGDRPALEGWSGAAGAIVETTLAATPLDELLQEIATGFVGVKVDLQRQVLSPALGILSIVLADGDENENGEALQSFREQLCRLIEERFDELDGARATELARRLADHKRLRELLDQGVD